MKYLNASILLAIPVILGVNSSLRAEEIHQIDDIPQEAVKHFEKGAANTFIKGWDDNEVIRLAKLLKVPPSDIEATLNLIEEKTGNFLKKYFRSPSSDDPRIEFIIKDQKLLADFISECKTLIEINSPLFLFKDTNINNGIFLPPEIEVIISKKFLDKNEPNLSEPQFMGLPVEDFTKQLILYSVSFGLASTRSEVLMPFLQTVGNHLPPTVGDIIVFRGVHNVLRDASIEMQSATKTEDETIKMDIKLVDWKILASAKNPIYRFLAIYSPYDNFQYTNEELLEFYQAYSNETDPEIRKYVMSGLQTILEDKEGVYKSTINQAKKLYDELEKKWRKR